jgi:hypothetical protein
MPHRPPADPVPPLETLHSRNPLAEVSAVRWRLRRAGARHEDIEAFSSEALDAGGDEARHEICRRWAERATGTTAA